MPIKGKTHYETLGVAALATDAQVKAAFRKLAKKHHPDAGGREDDFKAINEAYEVLSDAARRKEYDEQLRYGAAGRTGNTPGSGTYPADVDLSGFGGMPYGGGRLNDLFSDGDLEDIMGGFFGEPARRGRATRPAEVRYEVELDFDQALAGADIQTPQGKVRLPAGVTDGGTVRFPGKGEPAPGGGPPGDLSVTTRIRPHRHFVRDGADVALELPVSPAEAALGSEVSIPTPDGKRAKLRVPAGTQSGRRFRLKGKGAPRLSGGGHGDLVVTVRVMVPKSLSPEEREAYTALLPGGDRLRSHLS